MKVQDVIALLGSDFGHVDLGPPKITARQTVADRPFEQLIFNASTGADIPAYFLHPPGPDAPAILYCHAHGGRYDIGKTELTDGRPALTGPYLGDLAAAGYAVLCLEMPCFGARAGQKEDATAKALLWHGKTLFGQMLAELSAGITYLARHPDIDPNRIATCGISMGGTHAWWLAALDPRVRAAVSLCCFADLARLIETGAHDGHGNYMTVPGLLDLTSTGNLAGLTAPRAQFHGVGLQDWSTPMDAFEIARAESEHNYKTNSDQLQFHVENDTGHTETDTMRRAALQFLSRHN